jgi:hypothetical protein
MKNANLQSELDAVLGAALAQLEPIEPAPALRERMRAAILARAQKQTFFTIRAEEGKWHDVHPGVKLKLLFRDQTTQSFLLDIAPNTIVPSHDHPSDEECFVMQGEAFIGDVCLRAGDYHFATHGSRHVGLRSETGARLLIRTGAQGPRIDTSAQGPELTLRRRGPELTLRRRGPELTLRRRGREFVEPPEGRGNQLLPLFRGKVGMGVRWSQSRTVTTVIFNSMRPHDRHR